VAALWAVNAIACAPVTRFGPDRDPAGWRTYLGSARHDASAAESVAAAPVRVWRTDAGRAIRGAAAIGDSVIAVGTTDRTLVLLERAMGHVLWRRRLPGTVAGGPLIDGDRVYVATQATPDGRVFALQLRTGATAWRVATKGVSTPLALSGSLVVAVTDAGLVQAFDAATGTSVWQRGLGRTARATPVPTAEGLVVATIGDTLYLLETGSGAVRGRLATPGTVLGTPATDGRRLYCATTAGRVLAVTLAGFTVAWDQPIGDAVYGAPALVGDTLYVMTASGTLWRTPVEAPAQARAVALGLPATAGPTPTASGILIGGTSGAVVLVDAATDSIRWRLQLRGPIEEPPLVRDRQLMLVTGNGVVEAWR
jgi:outer membrane protein assembly factor BamB